MNTFLLLLSHINSRVSCHSDIEYEWKGRWVCELLQKEEASSKEDTGQGIRKTQVQLQASCVIWYKLLLT